MDGRQQRIAALARELLPFLERHEHRTKVFRALNILLAGILIFCTLYLISDRFRPINTAEERSLKVLLEYAAQQQSTPINERIQKLLDHYNVKNLGELSASQWNKAMACIGGKLK